jgi:hypothetical protein
MLTCYDFFTTGSTCMINDVMMVGQKKCMHVNDVSFGKEL